MVERMDREKWWEVDSTVELQLEIETCISCEERKQDNLYTSSILSNAAIILSRSSIFIGHCNLQFLLLSDFNSGKRL